MHNLHAGLVVWQAKGALVKIDVVLFQRHDFAKSTPSLDQQPRRQNGGGQLDPLAFHLPQHFADPAQLGSTEKPLAFLLGVFRDVLAWIRSIRAQSPHLGQTEHFGHHLKAAVCLIGNVPLEGATSHSV